MSESLREFDYRKHIAKLDKTIISQQAEIERLKSQRDRLLAEVKVYAGSTAYLAEDMRALIAEIEAEK